ncbi:MAG: winged helix-turn-helix domain-containing protein [Pseudomonadota bacterium]
MEPLAGAGGAGCAAAGSGDDYRDAPHCVRQMLSLSRAVGEASDDAYEAVPSCLWDYGQLRFDLSARRVARAGRDIPVTAREFAILLHLAWAGGRPVAKTSLYRAIFGLGFVPETNALAVHIYRLRRKLDHGFAVPLLRTVEGRGYALIPEG